MRSYGDNGMSEPGECGHLLGELSLYLDGAASAAICAEIENHMRDCEDCRVTVDTMAKTVYLYRSLPQPQMPEGLRRRLYKKLDLVEFLEENDD